MNESSVAILLGLHERLRGTIGHLQRTEQKGLTGKKERGSELLSHVARQSRFLYLETERPGRWSRIDGICLEFYGAIFLRTSIRSSSVPEINLLACSSDRTLV